MPRARDVDLGTTGALVTVYGTSSDDRLEGMALGDFNGDGNQDIVVAAPRADGPDDSRRDAGEVYVILGSEALPTVHDLAEGAHQTVIFGADQFDRLGRSLVSADFNDDGLDDFALGARGDGLANGKEDVGEVYIFFGKPRMPSSIDLASQSPDVLLIGADPQDDFGQSLAVGELDGDGIADLALGADNANGENNERQDAGEVHVMLGSLRFPSRFDLAQDSLDATFIGADIDDEFGSNIAIGDVNGDGSDDLVVSAEDANGPENGRGQAGEAYVIFGPVEPNTTIDVLNVGPDVTVFGADTDDRLGEALAVGDVTGDGVADLVIGAPRADGPNNARSRAGEAYLIRGSSSMPSAIDLADEGSALVILGTERGDDLGGALAAGLDLDGDGIGDLLVAADNAAGPGNRRFRAGEVYVILGSSEFEPLLEPFIDTARRAQSFTIIGADDHDDLGSFVGGGDFDGDGQVDLLLAAQTGNGPEGRRTSAGEVYILSGGDIDRDGVLDITDNCVDEGNPEQEDVDGDGLGDTCDSSPTAQSRSSSAPRALDVMHVGQLLLPASVRIRCGPEAQCGVAASVRVGRGSGERLA